MTPQEVAQAWAQAYAPAAPSTYQAPATTNYGNLSAGVGQDVLSHMQNSQMWAPNGGDGSQGAWYTEQGQPIYNSDPNGNPLPTTYGDSRLVYHAQGQGPGEQYATFDPSTGAFKGNETGSKPMSYAQGVLSVLGAGLGFGALAGAGAGAGAAAGTAGEVGSGAGFVGEGAASGIPAWDGALANAGAGAGAAGAGGVGVTGFGDSGTMYAGNTAGDAATLGGGASVNGGAALSSGGGLSLSDALKAASKVYGQIGQQQTAQAQTPLSSFPGVQSNGPSSYVGQAPGFGAIASEPKKSPMLGGLNNPWGSPYMVGLMGNRNGY